MSVHATIADSVKDPFYTCEHSSLSEAIAACVESISDVPMSRYPVTVYVDNMVHVTIVPQASGSIVLVFWDGRLQTLPTKESHVSHPV